MDKQALLKFLTTDGLQYALSLAYALFIFMIGWWIARLVSNIIARVMQARHVDVTIVKFVKRILFALLISFVIIAALSKLGVQTASLVAVLGAFGLAIGLSIKSSLSNLASGILLIIFRPFKVGDTIQIGSVTGTVDEILILYTRMITPQKQHIIIPNNKFQSEVLTNFSIEATRRADLVIGISYNDDIDKAKEVIQQVILADKRILTEPALQILVLELAESRVNLGVRFFTYRTDHFQVTCDVQAAIKKQFDQAGISLPYPQQDVHLINSKNA